jgi:hypothetical protein
VLVELALLGPPAGEVLVEVDADDLVRREEAVLDALLERVRVDRLAEVVRRRDVGRLLRRRGQADLGRAEVVEDLAPGRVVGALPRWHSSTMIRSKKSGENCRKRSLSSSVPVMAW